MPPMIEATLVEGQDYTKGNRKFEFNVPQVISQAEADYLAENAVKSVKQESGGKVSRVDVAMFKFAVLDEDPDDEPAFTDEEPGGYVPDENPPTPEELEDDDDQTPPEGGEGDTPPAEGQTQDGGKADAANAGGGEGEGDTATQAAPKPRSRARGNATKAKPKSDTK